MYVKIYNMKCKYFGKVRNSDGKIVDSRLYRGLLSITDRETADKIYGKTQTEDFESKILPRVPLDNLGEPTLLSVLAMSKELRESSDIDKVAKTLNKELNLEQPRTRGELDIMVERFNRVNPFKGTLYMNPIEHSSATAPIYWTAELSGRDGLSPQYAKFMDQLKDILHQAGFSIGSLTEYERNLGVSGVFDTDAVANGVREVIRLASGREGLKALPEEFAHLVISGVDEPPVRRLLSYLRTPGVVEKVLGDEYQTYRDLYKSEDKLVKEAAAKLLSESLEDKGLNSSERSILTRLTDLVKKLASRIFSKIPLTDINRIVANAKGVSLIIAEDALAGKYNKKLSDRIVTKEGAYYEIDAKTSKELELLKRLMRQAQIKLRVMQNRGSSIGTEVQTKVLNTLQAAYNKSQVLTGVTQYMRDISRHSAKMVEMIDNMTDDESIERRARLLSNVLSYTSSYIAALEDVKSTFLELKEDFKDTRGDHIIDLLNPLLQELQYSNIKIREKMEDTFHKFLVSVYGSEIVEIKTGSRKGTYKLADLIKYLPTDIGTAEMWMNGMAESTDIVAKIVDLAIRNKIGQAYQDTLDIEKDLMAAWKELKDAGIKNTEFLYEKDSQGVPTGRLITPFAMDRYTSAYRAAVSEYQNLPDFRKKLNEWKASHPVESFTSSSYDRLSAPEKKFYQKYTELKKKLEELLPKSKRDLYRAVAVRKDFIERLAGSGSVEDLMKQIKDGALDQVMRRVDDGQSAFSKGYLNISGELVRTIPILYTQTLEDPRSLSMDGVSALLAYAAMANRYHHLRQLEDVVNIGDNIMKQRKVGVIRGGKQVKAVFDKMKGIDLDETLLKEGTASNAYKRWKDMINTNMYGETSNESDQVQESGVSAMKTAGLLNKVSTMMDMGFNLMLGVANVGTGVIFQNTEAIAGQYFTKSQLASADLEFFKELPSIVGELPFRIKSSKIGLFNELMDIDQESLGAFRDKGIAKGALSRLFSMKTMLFMLGAGDYWIKTRSALALAKNTKLTDSSGKEVSLWDSLEKVPVDSNDPDKGYRLILREGLKDSEGREFTQTDLQKFRNKVTRLNHKIIGMMNSQDMNMAKKTVIGKLAFLYRSWMVPSWNRRMQKSTYDVLMDEESEGYYRTLFRVLKNIGSELRAGNIALAAGNLTDTEKYNLKRAITEMAQLGLIILSYNLLSNTWEDDDKNWLQNFILYELRRMQTEVGAVTPSTRLFSEANNIVKSPIASTKTLERVSSLFGLINPENYVTEVASGRYEGRSRAYKLLMESPIVLNANTVIRQLYPEEALKFYDKN